MLGLVDVPSGNVVSASERRGGALYKYPQPKGGDTKMKKQLAIAIVAILLTAVLLAPTVMAYAVRDGNSVQYSSHRGLNYITDNSVTASNQPYITLSNGIGGRETSSRVKYYRAPVPARTSNQPIVMSTGLRENVKTSRVFADDVLGDVASMNEKPVTNRDGFEIKSGTGEIINGTPILYIDTGDEIVPMKLTLIWMGDPSDEPHPSDGSGGYL